jgi:hypothetical protein
MSSHPLVEGQQLRFRGMVSVNERGEKIFLPQGDPPVEQLHLLDWPGNPTTRPIAIRGRLVLRPEACEGTIVEVPCLEECRLDFSWSSGLFLVSLPVVAIAALYYLRHLRQFFTQKPTA